MSETRKLSDLHGADKNPRTVTKARLRLLSRQLAEYGDLGGIVFNRRTKELVSGHQRMKEFTLNQADITIEQTFKKATKSGTVGLGFILLAGERFAYREVDWPAGKAAAALMAANNHAGEWDQAAVKDLIKSVGSEEREMTGFTGDFLKSLEKEKFNDVSAALPGAAALKPFMYFESHAIHQIPELRKDMLGELPLPITVWAGPDATEPGENYFYNLNTDSVRGLDFTKTVLGFYTDDDRFSETWENPPEFTTRLINRKLAGLVTPNFSLWLEWPEAAKIWSTYKARWCGRYWQEAGLKVIPDVNWSEEKSFNYCFAGIPKKAPCLAYQMQTAGKSTKEEIENKRRGFLKSLELLKPESIFIYGGEKVEEFLDELLPTSLAATVVKSRVRKRQQIMTKGGEKL